MDLCHSLEEKLKLLEKFLVATESLQKKVDLQETSDLQPLLDERQDLIRRIDRIDVQIESLLRKDPLFVARSSGEAKAKLNRLSKAITEILHHLETLDQRCAEKIISSLQETKGNLSRMKTGSMAVRCYGGASTAAPRFVDTAK